MSRDDWRFTVRVPLSGLWRLARLACPRDQGYLKSLPEAPFV
jgi:hypothetical protein